MSVLGRYLENDIDRVRILYGEYKKLLGEIGQRSPLGMSGGTDTDFWKGIAQQGSDLSREARGRLNNNYFLKPQQVFADTDPQMARVEADRRQRQYEENEKRRKAESAGSGSGSSKSSGVDGMAIMATEREKRRQDAIAAAADEKSFQAQAYIDSQSSNPYYVNQVEGRLTKKQQDRLDQRSMQTGWAARNSASDREAQRFADSNGFSGKGSEQVRIDQEMEAMEQSWAMNTDSYEVYEQRKAQIAQWGADQRTAAEQKHSAVVGNLQRSAFQQGVTLIQMFAGKSKIAAIGALALQKGLAIGETWVSTKAAEIRALAELGPIAGPPAAAAIGAWGAINMGLIAATGIAEGVMSGGMGGGTNSTGGGTAASPIVTQPQYGTSTGNALNITVRIDGNVISDDRWVEERLAPTIRDLAVNRNVSFGFQTV